MEYDQFTSLVWVINIPSSHDLLDVEMDLDEDVLESMSESKIPWEGMHHR
jgi:hypothetical protein